MFRFVCVLHNLMTLLQEKLGFTVYRTLGTLRAQLLTQGAVVGRAGHRTILRLSLAGPWREKFREFLEALFPSPKSNGVAVETG
jgi:hypothetical protein